VKLDSLSGDGASSAQGFETKSPDDPVFLGERATDVGPLTCRVMAPETSLNVQIELYLHGH